MKSVREYKVLHSPFDVEVHKKTFINYLEIVILEDGTIEYAVPSHQEKMIQICCEKLNVSRQELANLTPPQYYGDFMKWLTMVSKAIPVWNTFYKGEPNEKQLETLRMLQREGVFGGIIKL